MKRITNAVKGEGLRARAWRALGASAVNFGGSNFLRLLSNIVLTRLLFPEAFGLMLIISVFTSGLSMFSDFGIKASVVRSPRGDDEVFLNTAWSLQILRGFILGTFTALLAWPVSLIYGETVLFGLVLTVGLAPIISGFMTTRLASHERHMRLGQVTILSLVCQLGSMLTTIALAWWLQSVWALAIGSLVNPALRVLIFPRFLPGIKNRWTLDRECVDEIFGFGKFVFLSTASRFLITQGDKAIFGGYVSFGLLGIYNIGWGLGNLPQLLMRMFARRVVYPLYRMRPPDQSPENQRQLFKARRMLVAGMLAINATLAIGSVLIVDLLYDERYALAGPIIALICLSSVPILVLEGYNNALMSYGDSRRMFHVNLATAILQTALVFFGLITFGLIGGILAPGLAAMGTYPMLARYVSQYRALDPKADIGYLILGLVVLGGICAFHADGIVALYEAGQADAMTIQQEQSP